MIDDRHASSRWRPRLALGIAAVLVALPFVVGLYGPVEMEVLLWGVVMLAVGGALTAVGIGSRVPPPRWALLADATSVLLFVPAVVVWM
jgi:uncharacterized membrane protein HdeD (DUF308 family)